MFLNCKGSKNSASSRKTPDETNGCDYTNSTERSSSPSSLTIALTLSYELSDEMNVFMRLMIESVRISLNF